MNQRIYMAGVNTRRGDHPEDELWFHSFFATSVANVFIIQGEKIIHVNPSMEKLFGYSSGELVNKDISLLFHQDDLPLIRQKIKAGMAGDVQNMKMNFRGNFKDGSSAGLYMMGNVLEWNKKKAILGFIEHSTNQIQAEGNMQQNAQLLNLFVEYSPAAIAMFDKEMRYIVASRRYTQDYGLGQQNLIGRSHYEIFPEMPLRWKKIHQRCLAGAVERCDQDPFPRQDGSTDWVTWEIRPWYESTGEVGGIILFSEVVTDQVLARKAIQESEEQFRMLVENIPQRIFTKDLDLKYTSCNNNFARDFGLSTTEIIGKTDHDLLPKQRADNIRRKELTILQGGVKQDEEIKLIQNGDEKWIRLLKIPILDEKNKISGLHGVFWDITDRKSREEALRNLEVERKIVEVVQAERRRLLDVLETLPPMICLITRDHMVAFANRSYREKFGDVYSGHCYEVNFHRNDPCPFCQAFTVFETGLPCFWEVTGLDGSSFEVYNFPFTDSDGTPMILEMDVDVTERKRAEGNLHHYREQLEFSNNELEAFAYSVSHDLRAPLRGIDGWSLALMEDYYDKLDAPAREALSFLRSEAQRMGALIDDLLNLSRLTRADLEKQNVDLTAMAHTISARIMTAHPDRSVNLTVQPGLMAIGDPALMEIVLTNLLDNAWKYTTNCESAQVEFGRIQTDRGQAFFVRDNGIGFDNAYAGKLFGVFQRLHKQSEFPGSGIGLATVQRIIHRHGGQVWAEAKVNQGAVFYFLLPEDK